MSLELKFVKVQIVFLFGKKLFFLMDKSFYTFLFVSLKSMFKNAQWTVIKLFGFLKIKATIATIQLQGDRFVALPALNSKAK